MENLIDIFAKLLAILLVMGITWLTAQAKKYLTEKAQESGNADLLRMIETFCAAAEQQLKADDPTGELRKEYVEKLIVSAGYEITDIVNAAIEAAVYRINKGA